MNVHSHNSIVLQNCKKLLESLVHHSDTNKLKLIEAGVVAAFSADRKLTIGSGNEPGPYFFCMLTGSERCGA